MALQRNTVLVAVLGALAALAPAAHAAPVAQYSPNLSPTPYEGSFTGYAWPGQTLHCSSNWNDPYAGNGTSGSSGPSYTYAYQWRYKDTGAILAGQTTDTHAIAGADIGHTLLCRVTATDIRDQSSTSMDSSPDTVQLPPALVDATPYS